MLSTVDSFKLQVEWIEPLRKVLSTPSHGWEVFSLGCRLLSVNSAELADTDAMANLVSDMLLVCESESALPSLQAIGNDMMPYARHCLQGYFRIQ